MQKYFKTLIILLIMVVPYSAPAKAATITSVNDLIENAKALDGQEVTVQGEAIGERMDRGDDCWVNINDSTNAIGIWLNQKEAAIVIWYGDYKSIGDTVRITGDFHRACKEHGGESDIHVKTIMVIERGYDIMDEIPSSKIVFSIISTIIPVLLLFLYKLHVIRAQKIH